MNLSVNWIFENRVFDDNMAAFKEAIESQGHNFILTKSRPFEDFSFGDTPFVVHDKNKALLAVAMGSIEFIGKLKRHSYVVDGEIYPAYYCNMDNFRCSYYYPAVPTLNNKFFGMYPIGWLKNCSAAEEWKVLRTFANEEGKIFCRPDKGNKVFTGCVLPINGFLSAFNDECRGDVDPNELILLSPAKKLDAEWRLVVVDGKVVAGSRYKLNEIHDEDPRYPQEAVDLAEESAKVFQPDNAYVVDVCLCENDYHILELNSFSCSGLYLCNIEEVVRAVSGQVIKDWKEYNE